MRILTSESEGLKKLTVLANYILYVFYRAMIKKLVVNQLLTISWFDLIIKLIIKILSHSLAIFQGISICVNSENYAIKASL